MLQSAWSGNCGEKFLGGFVYERREKFITQYETEPSTKVWYETKTKSNS